MRTGVALTRASFARRYLVMNYANKITQQKNKGRARAKNKKPDVETSGVLG
jgi:hypothetical protein